MPDWVSPDAEEHWHYYLDKVMAVGVFTSADAVALGMLANITAGYVDACRREQALPDDAPNNVRWTHTITTSSFEKRQKEMLKEFGLTPAARVRVRGK